LLISLDGQTFFAYGNSGTPTENAHAPSGGTSEGIRTVKDSQLSCWDMGYGIQGLQLDFCPFSVW